MRGLRFRAACALASAGSALALAGGAFAARAPQDSNAQGNPEGIALAQHVFQAFSRLPAFTYTQRGFFQIHSVPGKTANVTYYYGYGALHPGFVWAVEHGTVALQTNQVLWWRDDLAPISGGEPAVELVADSAGVFSALGKASHHSCFERVTGSVPYPTGGEAYSVNGRYENGSSPLRSVYRWWQTAQPASETDVISSSGLISSGHVSVAPGAGAAGFSFDFSNAYPGSEPAAPQINVCR